MVKTKRIKVQTKVNHGVGGTIPHQGGIFELVRVFLMLIISVAATLTVVTHIAQITGLSFHAYAITGFCISFIVAALVLWRGVSKSMLLAVKDHLMIMLILIVCGTIGGYLSVASYRPDQDDAYYIPNAVYYLDNSGEAMDFGIHFLDSGGEPFISYHWATSLPFEYTQAILAHIVKLPLLTVYYLVAPALFGFMIPLVWYYAISRFGFSYRASLIGAVMIVLCLLLMGEQHRCFGNFAFNRIHQGKTVVLAVGIPLFTALSMDFFRRPSKKEWLYLASISTALVGFSASASVLLPLLGAVLVVACCVCYASGLKAKLSCGFWYLGGLFYPVLYAGAIWLFSESQPYNVSSINQGWSIFSEYVGYVFKGYVVVFFLVSGTIFAIISLKKHDRLFLVMWFVLMVVFYLNPLSTPILIARVVSPNIYWRLLYLCPFPLVIGLAGAGAARLAEPNKRYLWHLIPGVCIVLLLLAHIPLSSPSIFHRGTRLGRPMYKITNPSPAIQVLASAPPVGPMLATPAVSRVLPMLSAKYPQMRIRKDGLKLWMKQRDRSQEATHRLAASNFLGGKLSDQGFKSLIWVLRENPQVRTVVARREIAKFQDNYLFKSLKMMGFAKYRLVGNQVVFIRSD